MPSSIKLTEPLDILVEYGYLDEDKPYHKALNNAVMDFAENPDLGGEYNKEYVMLLQNEAKKELKLRRKKINVSKFFGKDQTTEAPAKDTTGTSSLTVRSKTGNIDTKKLIPQSSDEKKEGALAEILTGVNSIVDTLKGQQKQDKKHQSWLQKLQETFKRRKKENKLEFKVLDGIKNTATKLLAPFESAWTKVFNFIKDVFLGRILFKILEWMGNPDNQDKIKSITRFFQDWWPVMLGAYLIFGNALTGFALGLLKSVVVWGAKLASVVIPALLKAAVAMGPWGLAAVAVLGGAAYLATKKNKTDQKVDQSVEEKGRDETVDQLKEEKESKNMMERVGGFFTGEGQEREEQIQRVETGTEKRYGFFGELDRPAETQNFKEGGLVQHYNNATQEALNIIQGFNEGGFVQESIAKAQKVSTEVANAAPGRELDPIVDLFMDQMKSFYGITNTEGGTAVPDGAGGFRIQSQEELNKENNAKLPLGLKMTEDGQNIDLGRAAGDQVRMVGKLASDPQHADRLKEIGKQFGYDNLTGKQLTEISNQQADDIQFDVNRFIPGTESHRFDVAANEINQNTSKMKMVSGGVVSGPGGVDKVPARLTAGEFVMSKGAVQKYGANTLAAMNAAGGGTNIPTLMGGKPAYEGGGLVTVKPGEIKSYEDLVQNGIEVMEEKTPKGRSIFFEYRVKLPKEGFFGKQKYRVVKPLLQTMGDSDDLQLSTENYINKKMGWSGTSSAEIEPAKSKSSTGLIKGLGNVFGGKTWGGEDRVKPQRGRGQGNKIRAVGSTSKQPNIGPSEKKKVTVAYEEERDKMENKNKAAKPDQKIPEFDVFGGRSSAKMKVLGIMV